MGNAQSYMRSLASKADSILPSHYESGWYEKSNAGSDREQFIQGVVTVLTQNGHISLSDHELVLLYARRENERLIARIVAKEDGIIHAKIEPMELDVILDLVPGASTAASKNVTASDVSGEAASSQKTGTGSRASATPLYSPPAYSKSAH
ncbi:hypothetical protein KC351_g15272 [Hortaea werneckii]|nr:hypothetical protein KC351_g15272 [Hortaea werneckii]